MHPITNNITSSRFELREDGMLAFADYKISGNVISLLHVESDPALRGQGTAGRLMEGILEQVREKGMKVNPVCGYAESYIRRNPAHSELLA